MGNGYSQLLTTNFFDLMSLCRVSKIHNAIRKAKKSIYPMVGAVHAFPDWEIMILLPLLQQLDIQM